MAKGPPRRTFRLDRKIVRRFKGRPDADQDEGIAEHLAMPPEDRVELVGFLQRQHARHLLNLKVFPRMKRVARRLVRGLTVA